MRIRTIQVTASGELLTVYIDRSFYAVRELIGCALDTINLGIKNTVAYICRDLRTDKPFNKFVPGVRGDILITGGHGSYLTDIPADAIVQVYKLFIFGMR